MKDEKEFFDEVAQTIRERRAERKANLESMPEGKIKAALKAIDEVQSEKECAGLAFLEEQK